MATDTVIEGLSALEQKFKRMQKPAAYKAVLQKACRVVEADTKKRAHRVTGNLKASITHEIVTEGGNLVGYVGTNLEYAPYEEFGTGLYAENGNGRKKVPWAYTDADTGELIWTKGNHPHPFLRPALNSNAKRVRAILKDGMNGILGGGTSA